MATKRIDFRGLPERLHRLQVHACQRPDDFQMAQFFGPDVHQQVFSRRIIAVESLDGILHRRGQFAIGAAKLFQKHVAERGIGLINSDRVHQFLDVVIHDTPSSEMHRVVCC